MVADLSFPTSKLRRGRVQDNGRFAPQLQQWGLYVFEKVENIGGKMEEVKNIVNNVIENAKKRFYAIRKLTPSECFVLMGMNSIDVKKCRAVGISDSQLYKQAGNGLVTTHPQFIMEHLYKCLWDEDYITTDEQMVVNGYKIEE